MKNSVSPTAAIILSAGFGERLKTIGVKPFLKCRGKTFVELVVEKSKLINLDPIIVVTNNLFFPQLQKLKLPVKAVINHNPERGMLSSILIGMEELGSNCDGFFLCPVDFPLVKQETYNQLLLSFKKNRNQIIKPQFNQKSGHPIIFPNNLFDELKQAPLEQGARFVTSKYSHQTNFINVNDPGILININSPQMYQKYCK